MAKETSMKVSVDRPAPRMRPGIHYFVVPFRMNGKAPMPGQPQETKSEELAKELAARLAQRSSGVVAYQVDIDMEGEPVEEPIMLVVYGKVPGLDDVRLKDEAA